ncbi:MAG: mechanosensitive ion channel [Thermoplasmata archaeon]
MVSLEEVDTAIGAALVGVICLGGFEALGRFAGRLAGRSGARRGVVHTIRETARVTGIVIAVVAVVTFLGLAPILTVLTISGLFGLVISLALQATLSNIVSGALLLSERMIRHGDRITFGAIQGTVVRVALRSTWVQTDRGDIAVIGNTNLLNGPLTNHTRSPEIVRDLTGADAGPPARVP